MPHRVTSTKNESIHRALGISDSRFEQILRCLQYFSERDSLYHTEVLERVTQEMELSTNELVMAGIALGGFIEFQTFINGAMVSVAELRKNDDKERRMPVVPQMGMA